MALLYIGGAMPELPYSRREGGRVVMELLLGPLDSLSFPDGTGPYQGGLHYFWLLDCQALGTDAT